MKAGDLITVKGEIYKVDINDKGQFVTHDPSYKEILINELLSSDKEE